MFTLIATYTDRVKEIEDKRMRVSNVRLVALHSPSTAPHDAARIQVRKKCRMNTHE